MCIPGGGFSTGGYDTKGPYTVPIYKSSGHPLGHRLDQARRLAASTIGGGTFQGKTVLQGVPRNSGVDALRKTTLMGV